MSNPITTSLSVQPQLQLYDPDGNELECLPFPVWLRLAVPAACTVELSLVPYQPIAGVRVVGRRLGPNQLAIIRVLREAGEPLKAGAIARRAGVGFNGRLKHNLKHLQTLGLVALTRDGYQAIQPPNNAA